MKLIPFTMKAIALMLIVSCLHQGSSFAAAEAKHTLSTTTSPVKHAVLKQASLQSAVPAPLEDFSNDVVTELARQPEFKDWNEAAITYYPLGPGTHGWLAAVSQGNRQIGYLIFTAQESGGYMLSEYGNAESMPYSYDELYRRLVQESIIPPSSAIPDSIKIEAEYTSLLPVWKVTPTGKNALYINALTGELLPGSDPAVGKVIRPKGMTAGGNLHMSSTSLPSGTGQSDPYDNLLWLTAPRLNVKQDNDLLQAISEQKDSLVFTAPGHNAAYGSPFAITGVQIWSPANDGSTILYAATGVKRSRYLPVSMLLDTGELRVLPAANP